MLNPDKFNYVPSEESLILSAWSHPSYAFKWVNDPFVTNEYGEVLKGWEVTYLPGDDDGEPGVFFHQGVDADGCFCDHIEVTLLMKGCDVAAPYMQYGTKNCYIEVKSDEMYAIFSGRIVCLTSEVEVTPCKPQGAIARVYNGDFSYIEIVK